MKRVKNEVTGKMETHFQGRITKITDLGLSNSNGKPYCVCTIEYENIKGESKKSSGIIYSNSMNAVDFQNGDECNVRALPPNDKGEVLLIADPLSSIPQRATVEDFELEEDTVKA